MKICTVSIFLIQMTLGSLVFCAKEKRLENQNIFHAIYTELTKELQELQKSDLIDTYTKERIEILKRDICFYQAVVLPLCNPVSKKNH